MRRILVVREEEAKIVECLYQRYDGALCTISEETRQERELYMPFKSAESG